MSPKLEQARQIFLHAVGKLPAEEWDDYVARTAAEDHELREAVRVLLRSHRDAGSFLESPAVHVAATIDHDPLEYLGTQIGPYKLVEKLGEGGMGVVYLAEQLEPVRRQVALKIIKPGMDCQQVVARFEVERQALALMDHVNIARVHDGGTTKTGRPYFVMELVRGVPITKYCDDNHLSPRERLELFIPVCQAIQHAHQKGIIHRDIKPSNVLVSAYDGKPVPKVIDFGVAKATTQKLTERTMFTNFGALIGTLEYMSPEQAEMSPLGVDTRSDIYSLGVLLYELLTGSTPFSSRQFQSVALGEILRLIKEVEPPKPSTRLSASGDSLPSISAQRQMEPVKLTKFVKGELDWIVMKCLEKDRNRRYGSASDFAADIQRNLSDEAVLACPPSSWYRFRKWARRKKGLLTAASLVLLALIVGLAGTIWGMLDARAQERTALREANQARHAEAEAKAVLTFFEKNVLSAARPKGQGRGLGREATIREALDKAEPDINSSFTKQPGAEASIRRTLGLTYWFAGDYDKAAVQHEKALAIREAILGPAHPDTLNSMTSLGQAYLSAGRLTDARRIHERTLQMRIDTLGPNDSETLWTMNRLAETLTMLGRHPEALTLYEEILRRSRESLGPVHHDTLIYMDKLAGGYLDAGRVPEAIPIFEETLRLYRENLPANHPDTLATMNNLGRALSDVGRWKQAESLYQESSEIKKVILGPEHPETLLTLHNLGMLYRDTGRLNEALTLMESVVKAYAKKMGLEHHLTIQMKGNLAIVYRDLGRLDQAHQLFTEVLQQQLVRLSADHPTRLNNLNQAVACLLQMKKFVEAERMLREALTLRQRKTPSIWWVAYTKSQLGQALAGQERFEEAEPLLLQAHQELVNQMERIPARNQSVLANTAATLVDVYQSWNKPEPAARWRKTLESHQQPKADMTPNLPK